jgi:hypothetical protein
MQRDQEVIAKRPAVPETPVAAGPECGAVPVASSPR